MRKAKAMKNLGLALTTFLGFGLTFVGGTRPAQALTLVTACGQTLNAPGEYVLAGDLDCSGTTNNGVTITASNVVFHLAGYTIKGSCTSGDGGIVVNPGVSGVQIDGGTVSGFNDGIVLYWLRPLPVQLLRCAECHSRKRRDPREFGRIRRELQVRD